MSHGWQVRVIPLFGLHSRLPCLARVCRTNNQLSVLGHADASPNVTQGIADCNNHVHTWQQDKKQWNSVTAHADHEHASPADVAAAMLQLLSQHRMHCCRATTEKYHACSLRLSTHDHRCAQLTPTALKEASITTSQCLQAHASIPAGEWVLVFAEVLVSCCLGMLHSLLLPLEPNLADPAAQGEVCDVCELPRLVAGRHELLCARCRCGCVCAADLHAAALADTASGPENTAGQC